MKEINTKYSEKHWETICKIPQLTGILMSTAEFSGVYETKKELEETVDSISKGLEYYPDNKLIATIIPQGDTKEETLNNLKQQQEKLIKKHRITTESELKAFQNMVFGAYAEALHNISNIETAAVVEEFRRWILNIAEQVAVAAIEGNFLTSNEDPFSEKERIIFNKINKAFK